MIVAILFFSLHETSLQFVAEAPQKMLCVHVAEDKLGTLAHDFRQNGFSISINRCDLNEINDASPRTRGVMRFSPGRL